MFAKTALHGEYSDLVLFGYCAAHTPQPQEVLLLLSALAAALGACFSDAALVPCGDCTAWLLKTRVLILEEGCK